MVFAYQSWAGDKMDAAKAGAGSAAGASGVVGTATDLIERVRAGDPAAMAALYERHRTQGLAFARSLAPSNDGEDVLHEAFTKAVSAIRNGHGPKEKFGAYLSTCVRSVAATVWKKTGQENVSPFEYSEEVALEDPALETLLGVFEHEQVTAAMRTLPVRWRTVLWHAEVAGLPPRDIAPMLGIDPNAVSSLLIRARAGLRAAFELQTLQASAPAPGQGG